MPSENIKKKQPVKKVATPKNEKVDRKRKKSGSDDLTQEDITDLLGIQPLTPKEAKKAKVQTTPNTDPAKKKKKSPEKALKSPEIDTKSPKKQETKTEPTSNKKKRKAPEKDDEEEEEDDKSKKKEANGKASTDVKGLSSKKKKKKKQGKSDGAESGGVKEEEIEGLKELQAEQDKRKEGDNRKHLMVSGFSDKVTEADLRKLSVDIVDATIKLTFLKKKDGGSKYHAYLKFESEGAAERNIEKLRGKKLKGSELVVDYVGAKISQFKTQKGTDATKGIDIDPKRLYVTGFNRETITEEKLKDVFEGCCDVNVPLKKKDQKVIGYAFIGFEDGAVCRGYFEKKGGVEVDGCKLTICFARKSKA